MKNVAKFTVDKEKCFGCGLCTKVCPGQLLYLDASNKASIIPVDCFGWSGCWKCEHCMVVCPQGAISILGKRPEESPVTLDIVETSSVLRSVITNRRTCRRYLNRNVDKELIYHMISLLANAPNGGNKQQVEFTVIDDMNDMDFFRDLVYHEMEHLAEQGIFPEGFDQKSYEDMKRWETSVRPDMLFCGAVHLLIPHAPFGCGEPVPDVNIAAAYFELLCAANGLGCSLLTFPLGVLNTMPDIKSLLKIPEDHYIGMLIGFGYPEIKYPRGTQRSVEPDRIHRIQFEKRDIPRDGFSCTVIGRMEN